MFFPIPNDVRNYSETHVAETVVCILFLQDVLYIYINVNITNGTLFMRFNNVTHCGIMQYIFANGNVKGADCEPDGNALVL